MIVYHSLNRAQILKNLSRSINYVVSKGKYGLTKPSSVESFFVPSEGSTVGDLLSDVTINKSRSHLDKLVAYFYDRYTTFADAIYKAASVAGDRSGRTAEEVMKTLGFTFINNPDNRNSRPVVNSLSLTEVSSAFLSLVINDWLISNRDSRFFLNDVTVAAVYLRESGGRLTTVEGVVETTPTGVAIDNDFERVWDISSGWSQYHSPSWRMLVRAFGVPASEAKYSWLAHNTWPWYAHVMLMQIYNDAEAKRTSKYISSLAAAGPGREFVTGLTPIDNLRVASSFFWYYYLAQPNIMRYWNWGSRKREAMTIITNTPASTLSKVYHFGDNRKDIVDYIALGPGLNFGVKDSLQKTVYVDALIKESGVSSELVNSNDAIRIAKTNLISSLTAKPRASYVNKSNESPLSNSVYID
jgi:hypothetical protein